MAGLSDIYSLEYAKRYTKTITYGDLIKKVIAPPFTTFLRAKYPDLEFTPAEASRILLVILTAHKKEIIDKMYSLGDKIYRNKFNGNLLVPIVGKLLLKYADKYFEKIGYTPEKLEIKKFKDFTANDKESREYKKALDTLKKKVFYTRVSSEALKIKNYKDLFEFVIRHYGSHFSGMTSAFISFLNYLSTGSPLIKIGYDSYINPLTQNEFIMSLINLKIIKMGDRILEAINVYLQRRGYNKIDEINEEILSELLKNFDDNEFKNLIINPEVGLAEPKQVQPEKTELPYNPTSTLAFIIAPEVNRFVSILINNIQKVQVPKKLEEEKANIITNITAQRDVIKNEIISIIEKYKNLNVSDAIIQYLKNLDFLKNNNILNEDFWDIIKSQINNLLLIIKQHLQK